MSDSAYLGRRGPRPPAGYEDHLTRRQAARLMGLASEYKLREAEREGRIRAVRGAMGTAFYARADVEALGRIFACEAAAGPTTAAQDAIPAPPAAAALRVPAPAPRVPAPPVQRERRSELRLERAALIRRLRDPDPDVREAAFQALRETT